MARGEDTGPHPGRQVGRSRFSHDFPDEGEWEHSVTSEGITTRISKVGGGTPGRSYEGDWHYSYKPAGDWPAISGSDLHTGTPHTHDEAAELVGDFLQNERESYEYRKDQN